ncbi:MAG: hypothetical protein ABIJ92_02810 [Candidatus Aenigmatarchaeota archaeon]
MKTVLAFVLVFFLIISSVQALQLRDGMHFTLQPNTTKCIEAMIPDDLGITSRDKIDYIITSTADRVWSDLSQDSIIRTDANNTVIFPFCFFSAGHREGECSDPFIITLSAPDLGVSKDFHGGVCISGTSDFDIEKRDEASGETVADVINNNVDFFDIGFEDSRLFATTGETVTLSVLVESYGRFIVDLKSETDATINPADNTVVTSSTNPFHVVNFSVRAQTPGEYEIVMKGEVRGCDTLCSKSATATLIVTATEEEKEEKQQTEPKFSVSIFPETLNVKNLNSVLYRIKVNNNGEDSNFSTRIFLPEGLTSTLNDATFPLKAGEEKTIPFVIKPGQAETSYEIKITVTSNQVVKQAFSQLSVNEMATDAQRRLEELDGYVSDEDFDEISNQYDDWSSEYQNSEYGNDLEEYQDLQDIFNSAKPDPGIDPGHTPPTPPDPEQIDYMWIIIPIVIVIILVILVILYEKSRGGRELTLEEVQTLHPVRYHTLHPSL